MLPNTIIAHNNLVISRTDTESPLGLDRFWAELAAAVPAPKAVGTSSRPLTPAIKAILEVANEVDAAKGASTTARREANSVAYEAKRTRVQIPRAPVHRPIAEHVKRRVAEHCRQKVESGQRRSRWQREFEPELYDYGFGFVAHLLAFIGTPDYLSDGVTVPWSVRAKLAGTDDTSKLSKMTEALETVGIIVRANPLLFDTRDGAFTYRINPALPALAVTGGDPRTYATPRDFEKRQAAKAKPSEILDASFDQLPDQFTDLKGVLIDLQHRPMRCDKAALQYYFQNALDDTHRGNWLGAIANLKDGANYTCYTMAKSGRVQTYKPNLQGIPKKLRRFFYPTEGHVFLDFDFRSQESWILARLSGDQALMNILLTHDIYQLVANHLGVDRNEHAKPAVNCYHYGAGQRMIARKLHGLEDDVPVTKHQLAVARKFQQFMRGEFPAAARWMTVTAREIRRKGESEVPGGLIRGNLTGKEARKAGVNHIVQGIGATMLWRIMLKLDGELQDIGRLILPIHDGLLIEARADRLDDAERITRQVMEDAFAATLDGLRPPKLVKVRLGWRDDEVPAD